jgi:hypothetical protein
MAMNAKELRRHCEAKLRDLVVPDPFDLNEFCATLGRARGRPIILVPIALPGRAPCGICAVTDDSDYIFVQKQTSPLHRALIGLHELSHLIFGHVGTTTSNDHASRLFAPNLDPELVRHMLRRSHYSVPAEREAELLASLILNLVGAQAPPEPTQPLPAEVSELVRRLEASLADGTAARHA